MGGLWATHFPRGLPQGFSGLLACWPDEGKHAAAPHVIDGTIDEGDHNDVVALRQAQIPRISRVSTP
jgi:hypothetical protein